MTRPVSKSTVELADIFRAHIVDYQKKYKLHPEHYPVIYDILNCRTLYLGGHIERCDKCGIKRHLYNSCRNRHCPKCQSMAKHRWLEARKAELLPVAYFHVVFTLPHELNPLILCNKRVLLNNLFRCVSRTLLQFGENPKNRLGGRLGFITFLHTWDQQLNDHFHLHCLVPGGALCSGQSRWKSCSYDFLFPEKPLATVFRTKFICALQKAYDNNELFFSNCIESLSAPDGFNALKRLLYSKDWVVDIQEPIKDPAYVLEYVGRYTHRVAVSNDRILSLKNGRVTLAYKDRITGKRKTAAIEAVEFIRRFLLHVLPKGLMRIRHYGFLANRCKKAMLAICRKLLGYSENLPQIVADTVARVMFKLTGLDITRCPQCTSGTMRKILKIPRGTGPNAFLLIRPSRL